MRGIPGGKKSSPREAHKTRFDPSDFIVRGEDDKGQSSRVWCRVAPPLDRAIDVICESKIFPFRTKGDLIRWAIAEGVDILDRLESVAKPAIIQHKTIMKILQEEENNRNFMDFTIGLQRQVDAFINIQASSEARRLVNSVKAEIDKMEDGHWKRRYLQALKEKFGFLADRRHATGAGMGKGAFEDGPRMVDEDDDEE